MYATRPLMGIDACSKYSKPMLNKKSYWPDTNLHRQMDGQTTGQTDRRIPIYLRNGVHRVYNKNGFNK